MEVDLWSVGVVLHVLLTGSFPWAGNSPEELRINIRTNPRVNFELNAWRKVSKEG